MTKFFISKPCLLHSRLLRPLVKRGIRLSDNVLNQLAELIIDTDDTMPVNQSLSSARETIGRKINAVGSEWFRALGFECCYFIL